MTHATSHRVRCPNSEAAVMDDSRLLTRGHALCPRCGRKIAVRFSARPGKPDVFYAHNLTVFS